MKRKVKIVNPGSGVNKTLQPVPRAQATLEAEKGEVAWGDINNDTIPETYNIGGKRHPQGGTPLNLEEGTMIFSDTPTMRINDEEELSMFGKKPKGKKGYTPAEIAKQYDINKYREIIEDPLSDDLAVKTAERMISNYNYKLAGLAMLQESKKGFPQGIPQTAQPFLERNGIDPASIFGNPEEAGEIAQQQMAKHGAQVMKKLKRFKEGGLPLAQNGYDAALQSRAPEQRTKMAAHLVQKMEDLTNEYDRLSRNGSLSKEGEVRLQEIKAEITKWKPAYEALKKDINTRHAEVQPKKVKVTQAPTTSAPTPGFSDKWYNDLNFLKYHSSEEKKLSAEDRFKKKYPALHITYVNALKSNDPEMMLQVADELEKFDIDYSVGWIPGTDQDKLDDISSILREKANAIDKNKTVAKNKTMQNVGETLQKEAVTNLKKELASLNPTDMQSYQRMIDIQKQIQDIENYKSVGEAFHDYGGKYLKAIPRGISNFAKDFDNFFTPDVRRDSKVKWDEYNKYDDMTHLKELYKIARPKQQVQQSAQDDLSSYSDEDLLSMLQSMSDEDLIEMYNQQ
jgi:hypothetical protein